ncbi:MAG TPA: HAMP domain-containing sensor histidine kinase, partial [Balneolaceae bacterium]|nr:HAMP domain-containing sensor histidine kinase [Balneolaceae bacterium]
LEQSNRNLLKAADLLETIETVPDSITESIRSAEGIRSAQSFVVEQIILKNRYKIPTLILNEQGNVLNSSYISVPVDSSLVSKFIAYNPRIKITLGTGPNAPNQYIYYGESAVVRYLRYFPYIQLSLLALLLIIGYLNYRSINRSEQSSIWVGMTKEAAHQLGTPLSSLYGWVELLKEEKNENPFLKKVSSGLEHDINRLQEVAERFNKIGSEPELELRPVTPLINEIMDYAERRLPQINKNVDLQRPDEAYLQAVLNPGLFQWALENVIKNSMNAIKNTPSKAFVSVSVERVEEQIVIDVKDSGRGIEKKYYEEIFKPGYSTKKRGWGVGLSLTRRIIEDYHGGKIYVLRSELGKGTTIRIVLNAEG